MAENIKVYSVGSNAFMQDIVMCECTYSVVSIYNPMTFEDGFYHCFTCEDAANKFYDSLNVPNGMCKEIITDFHFVKIKKDNAIRTHIINGDGIKTIGNDTNGAYVSFDSYIEALHSSHKSTKDAKKREAQIRVANATYRAWHSTDDYMFISNCVVSFACDLFYLACDFADDTIALNYLMHVAKKFIETFDIQY